MAIIARPRNYMRAGEFLKGISVVDVPVGQSVCLGASEVHQFDSQCIVTRPERWTEDDHLEQVVENPTIDTSVFWELRGGNLKPFQHPWGEWWEPWETYEDGPPLVSWAEHILPDPANPGYGMADYWSKDVTYTEDEADIVGTITLNGLYTAPATLESYNNWTCAAKHERNGTTYYCPWVLVHVISAMHHDPTHLHRRGLAWANRLITFHA